MAKDHLSISDFWTTIERNSFWFESIPHFGLLVKGFESPLTFLQNSWTFESGRAEADFDLLLLEVA